VLEQGGKTVGMIAPLLSPKPAGSAAQSLLMEHEGVAWLGTASESGVWIYPLSQHKALGLTCAEHLQSEPSVAAQAEAVLNPDGATHLRMSVSPPGALLLNALSTRCNLAQGEFARNTHDRFAQRAVKWTQEFLHARPWRWARWSAALVVGVHLLSLNTWAWLEHRELGAMKQQMQDLLTQTFPQVKVVVDAPIQMQKELQILEQRQGSATATDLEALLSLLGQAGDAKAATSLEYAQGQLTLRDASLSPPQLERLRQMAQARQLTVRTQGNDLVVGAAP